MDEAWTRVLLDIVDAYLEWRHAPVQTCSPTATQAQTCPPTSAHPQDAGVLDCSTPQLQDFSSAAAEDPSSSAPGQAAPSSPSCHDPTPPSPSSLDYTVEVFDLRTLQTSATIPRTPDMSSTAKALVLAGYLGTTPVMPTLAISLDTLELLRVIHMFKASYSIESFVKLLCYYYKVRE